MKIKKSAAKTALNPTEKTSVKTSTLAAKVAAPASLSVAPPAATTLAPVKAPAPTKVATPAVEAKSALTTIEVKLDVGFGNAVFLRGHGGPLTWERGVPLACVDAKTWRWSGEARDPITFKLLINDQIWSAGNDLLIAPGQKIEVAPEFA
jgi:hypothetical protein